MLSRSSLLSSKPLEGLDSVDLFSGIGGGTEAMTSVGLNVLVAANHWRFAVDTHTQNHPNIHHELQDLRQANFAAWPDFDIGWCSPSCQGSSQAAQPARKKSAQVRSTHDRFRSTAWAVIDLAEVKRPKLLIVENVVDFRRWPLYDLWIESLRRFGYKVTENVLHANRWGVPQRRGRLFVIAHQKTAFSVVDPSVPEPAFGPCIDWDEGRWVSLTTHRSDKLRERVSRARSRGLGARFLVQNVTGHRGVPLTESIRTITTQDQWGLVDGDRYRLLTLKENLRAQGFRDDLLFPEGTTRKNAITGIGNAVPPPVAAGILREYAKVAA
jgi:DNA (cytosine-5)-methyltransferase 1